jgi:hypothetical protein
MVRVGTGARAESPRARSAPAGFVPRGTPSLAFGGSGCGPMGSAARPRSPPAPSPASRAPCVLAPLAAQPRWPRCRNEGCSPAGPSPSDEGHHLRRHPERPSSRVQRPGATPSPGGSPDPYARPGGAFHVERLGAGRARVTRSTWNATRGPCVDPEVVLLVSLRITDIRPRAPGRGRHRRGTAPSRSGQRSRHRPPTGARRGPEPGADVPVGGHPRRPERRDRGSRCSPRPRPTLLSGPMSRRPAIRIWWTASATDEPAGPGRAGSSGRPCSRVAGPSGSVCHPVPSPRQRAAERRFSRRSWPQAPFSRDQRSGSTPPALQRRGHPGSSRTGHRLDRRVAITAGPHRGTVSWTMARARSCADDTDRRGA